MLFSIFYSRRLKGEEKFRLISWECFNKMFNIQSVEESTEFILYFKLIPKDDGVIIKDDVNQ